MDGAEKISLSGFVVGLCLLYRNIETSSALDLPVYSAAFVLACTGLSLLLLYKLRPGLLSPAPTSDHSTNDSELLLATTSDGAFSSWPQNTKPEPRRSVRESPEANALLLILLIVARIELLRRALTQIQCSQPGLEALLPLLTALYDATSRKANVDSLNNEALPNRSFEIGAALARSLKRTGQLIPAVLITWGCTQASSLATQPHSTYICFAPELKSQIFHQYSGVCLDALIISTLGILLGTKTSRGIHQSRRGPLLASWVSLTCAVILLAGASIRVYMAEQPLQFLIVPNWIYLKSVLKLSAISTCTALFGIRSLSRIRPLVLVVVSTLVTSILTAWKPRHFYTLVSFSWALFSVILTWIGLWLYLSVGTKIVPLKVSAGSIRQTSRQLSWKSYAVIMALFILRLIPEITRNRGMQIHPIEVLMKNGKTQHDNWLKQASSSNTLAEAVEEYHRRYRRSPPPGFDQWHSYASARSAAVMDDYDNIENDLLPFWALAPLEIRDRTWEMTSNPWSEVSGISIRNGSAKLGANTRPTHRWMMEGIVASMEAFVEWLPDMDLAFNLNDECRVATPWESIETKRAAGRRAWAENPVVRDWSLGRASSWRDVPEKPIDGTRFVDQSFTNTYYTFGATTCPPGSRARQDRIWDLREVCTSCAAPHSFGPFLQNWTLSADICHQPDLANLHGFFISPADFKTSRRLMPVFSQSKVHGYSDIRYPSAWNYMDKVKYEPSEEHPDVPFLEKENTLFWRGATSEGVSYNGGWQGMARQRLVSLGNISSTNEEIPILLPSGANQFSYENVPAMSLPPSINIDVGIVEEIARCRDGDCIAQAEHFGLKPRTDFQEHWRYRYLVDLDGGGFSGRYLSFLRSRSLPFKAALFREWYDDRLAPWVHFVPQDLRFHGLWSTLAYFAGWEGTTTSGMTVKWAGNAAEAGAIAEAGRTWAEKALRKEDMEIYFYRLLLEWGRLTDDRRREMGFKLA